MPRSTADQLLDAQVAYLLDTLTGEALQRSVRRDVEVLWAAASRVRLDALVTAEEATRIVHRLLTTVPASVTTSTMLEEWTDLVLDGPPVVTTPEDVVDRAHVEGLLAEALAGRRVFGDGQMDRLAESPQVGALASKFISLIVTEAVQANRAVAERIPGMGSIMSLGTSAASRVAGVADKPLQAMGDTAGKGAAMAVRRLRKVVVETLDDPVFAAAVMEVWDIRAGEPIGAVEDEQARAVVHRVIGLLQQIAVEAISTPQAEEGVAAFVEAFFDVYGEHPPTTLFEEVGIQLDDLVSDLQVSVPRLVDAMRADGSLETAIRSRLEPFFSSPAVAAVLSADAAS